MNDKTFTETYTSFQANLQKYVIEYKLPTICKIEILHNLERSLTLHLQQLMKSEEKIQNVSDSAPQGQ